VSAAEQGIQGREIIFEFRLILHGFATLVMDDNRSELNLLAH
jgi:hypothetical protein